MAHHQLLSNTMEDQLSLASIHYMRMHYTEAIEIYKSILEEHIFLFMLKLKVPFVLRVFRRGQRFHKITKRLAQDHFVQVVFNDGDGALQVFPGLMDTLPEARINLILYHLKRGYAIAHCTDLEPQTTTEFLVKAVTFAFWGQMKESVRRLHSDSLNSYHFLQWELNHTIPGRQSMACSLFLSGQYDDALVYLNSIQVLFSPEMQCGMWKEAEEHFLAIAGRDKDKPTFKYMLTKTFIMNHKPQMAWDMYTRSVDPKESFNILRIIATDCYTVGEFYYAARAFDGLEKIDPSPENWQGKRGAACGLFKIEQMSEVLQLLDRGNHPQADFVTSTIRKWAKKHDVNLE
ncbi:unnamed protein product [Angiostrongylus costaricensis]|uniref:TPR_REGION domain-containing protein n=1 Tax=Angiostrongylus costaricensis TaxID=334426 RepID=A0A0R3PJY5_ANGCS|nr:unnamed protein product [Angiostrongylus costaricensis]